MKFSLFIGLFIYSCFAWSQQDPQALNNVVKVVSVIAPEETQMKNFDLAAIPNCDEKSSDAAVEVPDALLGHVSATGGITPVPGTDKSIARGVVTVVDHPEDLRKVEKARQGSDPNQDMTYTVINTESDQVVHVKVKGSGLHFIKNVERDGHHNITFSTEVEAKSGGRILARLRIIR